MSRTGASGWGDTARHALVMKAPTRRNEILNARKGIISTCGNVHEAQNDFGGDGVHGYDRPSVTDTPTEC